LGRAGFVDSRLMARVIVSTMGGSAHDIVPQKYTDLHLRGPAMVLVRRPAEIASA
jgi:hypothetical protein